jgi:cytochrome c oxidase subunit IV
MATKGTSYVWTWLALVILTTATFLLSRVHLGFMQVPTALIIALAKGLLVVLIFMHLLEQRSANRVFFLVATLFIVLLVGLMTADVITR